MGIFIMWNQIFCAVQNLDEKLIMALARARNPVCDIILTAVTHLGDLGIIWIAICVAMLFFKKLRHVGCAGLISFIAGTIINNLVLKPIILRPRPYLTIPELIILIPPESSFSMPSGHSASAFSAAWFFLFCLKLKALPYIVLAALIAFSRVYVGVHYPSDVICGMLLGLIVSVITYYAATKIKPVIDRNA